MALKEEGRRNRRLSCIFECNERSLTRSAPLSPREISTRRERPGGDDRGVHDSRIYVTKMSKMRIGRGDELRLTLCLNLLSLSPPQILVITIISIFSPTSVFPLYSIPSRNCVCKCNSVSFKLCLLTKSFIKSDFHLERITFINIVAYNIA